MPREYEYSQAIIYGGPTGVYPAESPWNTPCEVAVVGISLADVGGILLLPGYQPNAAAPDITTFTPNAGGAPGFIYIAPAAAALINTGHYFALPSGKGTLVVKVANSKVGLATLVYRRIDANIPQMPDLFTVHPNDEFQYHDMRQRALAGQAVQVGPREG